MAHPVTWFQIDGKDGSSLQEFYRNVFGWRMSAGPGGMAMVEPDQPGGIAGGIGTAQDGTPRVSVYVNTDDIEAHLAKIEGAGGRTAMPAMELPGGMGWIAAFLDPEGNVVGLYKPGAEAAAAAAAAAKPARAKRAAKKSAKRAAKKSAKKAAKKGAKKGARKAAKKGAKKAAKKGASKAKG